MRLPTEIQDSSGNWVQGTPDEGMYYRTPVKVGEKTLPDGSTHDILAYEYATYVAPVAFPTIEVNTVRLIVNGFESQPVGDIFWLNQGDPFRIEADLSMPTGFESLNSNMVIMAERVIDGSTVVDDERFMASIANSQLVVEGSAGFEVSGNYFISPDRLNRGLERISAPFRVSFSPIEFDVIRAGAAS